MNSPFFISKISCHGPHMLQLSRSKFGDKIPVDQQPANTSSSPTFQTFVKTGPNLEQSDILQFVDKNFYSIGKS